MEDKKKARSERLISSFTKSYMKEYDFYNNLAKKACSKLEDELIKAGVRSIVSYRAKGIESLKRKLQKRSSDNNKKSYNKVDDIYNDIADLSGVRVALYFPGDIEIVDSVIEKTFAVKEKKTFPQETTSDNESTLVYKKRFSGYAAKHYRVCMNGNDRYSKEYKVEIQVASVLMHAWSEVEHDLIYKPSQGSLSKEELMILDEINGLVIAGNIALERLQDAGSDRVAEGNYEFKNHYDLSLFITLELGVKEILNSKGTFTFLERINKTSRENVKKILDASKLAQESRNRDTHSLEPDQLATINILISAAEIYPIDVIDALLDGLAPINIKTLRAQLCLVGMGHTKEYAKLFSCVALIMKIIPEFTKSESSEKIQNITESQVEKFIEIDESKITYKEAAETLTSIGKTIVSINEGKLTKQRLGLINEQSIELLKKIKQK